MASQSDQFFKEKFSKFLQEKDMDSDDEYDTEHNPSWTASLAGRLGGISLGKAAIPHDEDLDVPHTSLGLGGNSLGGKSLGGLGGLGGRTGGSLGGRSLGGLGGLGGRSIGGLGGSSRGISRGGISQGTGLGGLGRGKTPQSVSSSDNFKPKSTDSRMSADVPTSTNNIGDMSKALGDIAKGTTALQKEVAAFISDSQQKNMLKLLKKFCILSMVWQIGLL